MLKYGHPLRTLFPQGGTSKMKKCILLVLSLVITGCSTSAIELSTTSNSTDNQESSAPVSPIFQEIPFRNEPVSGSLRYSDLYVGMIVCVKQDEGVNTDSHQASIESLPESTPPEIVYLSDSLGSHPITTQGYGLEDIDGKWANAWLTAGNC